MLSDNARKRIQGLIARYPQPRSALIPALHIAQAEAGYLPSDIIEEIAGIFELSPSEVYEVVSFYTMFFRRPPGKYVIQVCTNISCLLCKSEGIMDHLQNRLGIRPGQTTPDNKFTLIEVECLASCGTAPVVQINENYHENLTPEKLDGILDTLN